MAGKVLDLKDLIIEDQLGTRIADKWVTWNNTRQTKVEQWKEIRQYVYATDTTQTTNSKLPWKNKTTIPKLCQVRDNLYANYMAALFPKRKWLKWEGNDESSETLDKRNAIQTYAEYMTAHPNFKQVFQRLVFDYIDYGNAFVMPDWQDSTVELEDRTQVGYVGPVAKRISPLDIVFDPTAEDFSRTPKIIRSIVSLGQVKEMLTQLSTPDNTEAYEELFKYLTEFRQRAQQYDGDIQVRESYYQMDGFDSWKHYLTGDYVELLFFYGDIYDYEKDEFLRNHTVIVVDRHKVLLSEANPSYFGTPPIYHIGWRPRQDNLWAMGPLDNLVGMQYRVDHIENLKADVFDLITFPPIEVKGQVDDFTWQPFEKIYVGDEGSVRLLTPPFQVLEANAEIAGLTGLMEEMAGAPKEALGFRTPGEKTKYEVQRLENAASRVFQNKTVQFEEQFLEPLLNGMLELARRKMSSAQFRVFDDEFKAASFMEITPDDLNAQGRLRPVSARHFAEQAEIIQNLTAFFNSPIGQDKGIQAHFSTIKMAKLMEDVLNIAEYEVVTPYVRSTEEADYQRMQQANQEQVSTEAMTATGQGTDYDLPEQQMPQVVNPEGLPQV